METVPGGKMMRHFLVSVPVVQVPQHVLGSREERTARVVGSEGMESEAPYIPPTVERERRVELWRGV